MRYLLLTPVLVGIMALPATGQAVRHLDRAEATYAEAFSFVQRVRELPDGRLLVADPIEQTLWVLDRALSSAEAIGRVGQGPDEYRQPDAVFPLPENRTLLVDLGNARLTELGSDLEFGITHPIARSFGESGGGPRRSPIAGMVMILPQAVDGAGRVYFASRMGAGGPGAGVPDSAPVTRWALGTTRLDTVATVKLEEMRRQTAGQGNVMIRPVPLSARDAWAIAADGEVVVVRSSPYRVEWIGRDGTVRVGPVVNYQPVRIRRAEKERWADGLGNGINVRIEMNNGARSMAFGRGGGGGNDGPDLDAYEWPETMPAFDAGAVWVAPAGEVWVGRSVAVGERPRYDIFDRNGALTEQVTLPEGRRIVGFGDGVVYTVSPDEFDLLYLERYVL